MLPLGFGSRRDVPKFEPINSHPRHLQSLGVPNSLLINTSGEIRTGSRCAPDPGRDTW